VYFERDRGADARAYLWIGDGGCYEEHVRKTRVTPHFTVDGPLVQPDGQHDSGPCACCGNMSRRVWGYIHSEDGAMTLYYVHWTLNGVAKHGARFNLVLGNWGADTQPRDRASVALNYRQHEGQPQFMVIDATPADTGNGQLGASHAPQ
jgi:hypothetical protein